MSNWIESRNSNGAVVLVSAVIVTVTEPTQTMKVVCSYCLFVCIVVCMFVCVEPMYHKKPGFMWTQFYVCNETQLN
jgi:hypothetical protein